jgi:type II secretory pathway component PulF
MRSSTAEQMSYTHHVGGSNPPASTMNLPQTGLMPDEVDLETAKKIFKGRRIYAGITLTAVWVVVGVLMLAVWPKMRVLYEEIGVQPPYSERQIGYGLAGLMIFCTVTAMPLFSNRWEEKVQTKIRIKDIPGKGVEPMIIMVLGLGVGLLMTWLVRPIYQITGGV